MSQITQPARLITYIDGFNLYFGLREAGFRRYYWLDVEKLSSSLARPDQEMKHTKYFTSRVSASATDPGKDRRQAAYLEALETLPNTSLFYGHYLNKTARCRQCGSQWNTHEEKMTDVNIAVELLSDAHDDRFDVALIISADSDLVGPIERVRQRYPDKRVIVAFPPNRTSDRLKSAASGWFRIGEAKLRQSQLPNSILKPTGFTIQRPPEVL